MSRRGGGARGALILVVLVAVLLAAWLVLRGLLCSVPAREPSGPLEEAPALPGVSGGRAVGPEAASKPLERRLRPSPKGPPEVRITEAELNSLLKERLPEDKVRSVKARIGDGFVEVSALVRYKGRWLFVEARGRPVLEGWRAVRFEPEKVRVGRLPVPGFMAKRLKRRLGELRLELPVEVDSLRVERGEIVLVERGS